MEKKKKKKLTYLKFLSRRKKLSGEVTILSTKDDNGSGIGWVWQLPNSIRIYANPLQIRCSIFFKNLNPPRKNE